MTNPNNNMNAYNQALKINRALKKRVDRANLIIDDLLDSKYALSNEHLRYLHDLKEVLNARETTDD